MKNKHYFLLFVAATLMFSCQKDVSLSDLDGKYTVYTDYDKDADFKTLTHYFLPDSILIINSNNTEAKYWKDANAQKVVEAFVTNLNQRGYVRVLDKVDADLGIQLSFAEVANYYVDTPYWWNDYPYYWPLNYWGNWGGGWYYPYSVVYSYTSGSLIGEAIDLTSAQGASAKLPVIWNVFLGGVLSNSANVNTTKLVNGIDQAFIQSPYIKANVAPN